jgi:hypothetical protein
MHFSRSSYSPVFACIFVCICLYLLISVSLMRRQRARDSIMIIILSQSRSRTGRASIAGAGPARPADSAGAATSRATALNATCLAGKTRCSKKESEPRSGRRWRPEVRARTRRRCRRARSVSSWSSNLHLTTLDLVQPHWDVTIFLHLPTNIIL